MGLLCAFLAAHLTGLTNLPLPHVYPGATTYHLQTVKIMVLVVFFLLVCFLSFSSVHRLRSSRIYTVTVLGDGILTGVIGFLTTFASHGSLVSSNSRATFCYIALLLLQNPSATMASLRHHLNQAFGLSDSSAPSPTRHCHSVSGDNDAARRTVQNASPSTTRTQAGQSKAGTTPSEIHHNFGQRSVSAQPPRTTDTKPSLRALASNTFKTISRTLRAKAQYFYTESERARLNAEDEAAANPDSARRSSRSRLLDSLRKHGSISLRKSRRAQNRTNADSVAELARMDPSNVGDQSPSLDVSIPHSALLEPDCKFPWMGSRNGRDHSTRSRASIADSSCVGPSPVTVAVRRSSRGATGVPTQEIEDAAAMSRVSKSTKATSVTPLALPSRRTPASHPAPNPQTSVPLIQRRLSIFKVFRRVSGSSSDTLEQAISESFDSLEDLPLQSEGGTDRVVNEECRPNMGSKTEWEQARADRQRRYQEISGQWSPRSVGAREEPNKVVECGGQSPIAHRSCEIDNDNDTVIRATCSESSGSRYESDTGSVSETPGVLKAFEQAGRHRLERTSVSIESWKTSYEHANEALSDITTHMSTIGPQHGQQLVNTPAESIDPLSSLGGQRAKSSPDLEPVTASSDSESTTASCAVTCHEPPAIDVSGLVGHHHRRLSEHGDIDLDNKTEDNESKLLNLAITTSSVPDIDKSFAQLNGHKSQDSTDETCNPVPSAGNSFCIDQNDVDNASVATGSTTTSLPRLRRMPRASLFREESRSMASDDDEAEADGSVVLPEYDKLTPGPPPNTVPSIHQEKEPTPCNLDLSSGRGRPLDSSSHESDNDSSSSSSVESWLRSHPDFEVQPDLSYLSNARTLSAELLRYSSARSTVSPSQETPCRLEENFRTRLTPSQSGTRQSSAQESVSSDGVPVSRQRESLIPIPANSPRRNLGRASTPAAEPTITSKAASVWAKGSDTDPLRMRTPDEPIKRPVQGGRVASSGSTHTPTTDPHRQVRFSDDTPEMLASRSARALTASAQSHEVRFRALFTRSRTSKSFLR